MKSKNKINLIVLKTPFQLMNVYEALIHFNIRNGNNNNVLVITSINKTSISQLQLLLSDEKEIEIQYLSKPFPFSSNSLFFLLIKKIYLLIQAIKWKKRIKYIKNKYEIENLITGNIRDSLFIILANNIPYKKVICVDDGLASYKSAETRNNEKKEGINFFYKNCSFLFRYYFNISPKPIKEIAFFSLFNLEITHPDSLIINSFQALSKQNKKTKKVAYIIGGPYIEKELLSDSDYFSILNIIKNKFDGYDFLYFPHRQEIPVNLRRIESLFKVYSGILPLENYILNESYLPQLIVGFYSTALCSIKLILKNENVEIIAFKTNFKGQISQEIEKVYTFLENEFDIKIQTIQ